MYKSLWTSLTVSAFLPLLALHADQSTMTDNTAQSQTKPMRPQAVNPSGRPQVKGGANLFITADYLLWQATEQNLNYASDVHDLTPIGAEASKGHVFNAEFNWQSGFRVGIGYNIGHDQWDTNITWTWFEDDASGHAKATDANPGLYSTINSPNLGISCLRAKSDLGLHLNLLDWELGREFYSSKWLSLRPFAGIRTGWVHQNWRTEFSDNVIFARTHVQEYIEELKQEFWGIGLRGGLDTEWALISGLSIYADGAFSLLYGFFEDSREEGNISLTGIKSRNLFGENSKRCEQSITELQMGLRWDQMFSNDRFHFRIQAGWDHMVFFDHNHLFFYTSGGAATLSEYGGNLAFQGWSASARFDF